MFEESDFTIDVVDQGYAVWFARRRAEATRKALVVLRAPEAWEEQEAIEQAW